MLSALTTRISVQILFCFVLVIVVLTIGLVLALFSLSKLQQDQTEFAATTAPLVETIESINHETLSYLIEVEAMLRANDLSESKRQTRRDLENEIRELMTELQQSDLNHLENYRSLGSDLETIFEVVATLEAIQGSIPQQIVIMLNQKHTVEEIVQDGLILLTRHDAMAEDDDSFVTDIKDSFQDMQLFLAQVGDQNSEATATRLSQAFTLSLRQLSQLLPEVSDPDLQYEISIHAGSLFEQTENDDGFFNLAVSHANDRARIMDRTDLFRTLATRFHASLTDLLALQRTREANQAAAIGREIESIITQYSIAVVVALLLSITFVALYAYPRFSKRLDQLSEGIKAISIGRPVDFLQTSGQDEIALMGRALKDFHSVLQLRDETRRRIEASEKTLNAILDNSVDGVLTINTNGQVRSYNKACISIFGYQPEEVIGQNITMLMPKPYQDKHNGNVYNYQTSREAWITGMGRELEGVRKNGRIFPIEVSVAEIETDAEKLYAGIVRDITSRKEHERERENLIHRLTESNVELERFAHIASHDLQEPLRMVASFSELFDKKYGHGLDHKGQQYLSYIMDGAHRMQLLVTDLLAYSRVGTSDDDIECVDMDDVMEDVKLNLAERIRETGTRIDIAPLPPVTGSRIRVTRLMQNLVVNAIRYQPEEHTPCITISAQQLGDWCEFSVSDNGIGMAEEYCERIFEPFRRLNKRTDTSGTGMGLAICRKIVEGAGGSIRATSYPGNGSVFTFTLPSGNAARDEHSVHGGSL